MNKQVEQIRAEVYRRFVEAGIHEGMIAETREDELNSLLSFIDSMGEDRPEPISPADVGFEALGKVWDENAKKESGKLTQSVTKTSDQEMPVSDDLEKEIDRWSKEQCYNKSEKPAFAAVARHFAQWQKQQMIKTAKLSGWVARDENGNLHLFEMEPTRLLHRWWDRDYQSTTLDNKDFPDLKWEDKPIYVKLVIIKED